VIRTGLALIAMVGMVFGQVPAEEPPFSAAVPGRTFSFPQDHGKHPDFQTEWWYFTGNLRSKDNRAWGFQLTFFRRSFVALPSPRQSSWTIRDLYPAHFAITDLLTGQFFHTEVLTREGPGLASAAPDDLKVHVKDWSAQREENAILLKAQHNGYALDVRLVPAKPVVLHGKSGFSRKGNAEDQASYYYSFTRLNTQGTLTFQGKSHKVEGLAWMDHEFGSSILLEDQAGWDWFSLQLDDGTELMVFHLRKRDGTSERPFGTFVPQNGMPEDLDGRRIVMSPGQIWTSPHTAARYPLTWTVQVPDKDLSLEIATASQDQELTGQSAAGIAYWEGAVTVKGSRGSKPVEGRGYMELTGYARSLGGRL
jgi:predicted secreted hydrolase